MHEASNVLSFLFVLIACVVTATILIRFRQPTIVGYILGGIIIGPNVLGIVPLDDVSLLSEIGISLLMFAVGLELSLQKLVRVKGIATIGGSIMLLLTIVGTSSVAYMFHWSLPTAITIGCIIAFSSTVIVLRILSERGEIGSTHGNVATGVLIFQDIVAVPMLVIFPILAVQKNFSFLFVTSIIGQIIIYAAALYALSRFLVPKILFTVSQTNSKELFSITILTICAGIAVIAHKLGISLALGAFLAGIIISESDFGNQATSDILPLKDAFGAIFFASIGMLLDPKIIIEHWFYILIGILGIILGKFFVSFFVTFLFRYPVKAILFTSISLAQVGEFSLLLLLLSYKSGLLTEIDYQFILASSVISIIATPYLLKVAPSILRHLHFLEKSKWLSRELDKDSPHYFPVAPEGLAQANNEKSYGHVILCGYGPTGSIVMKKIQAAGLATVVIDLNYKVIQSLKKQGVNAIYGDCSNYHVLEAAGIRHALLLIVTIPDQVAMRAIVKKARTHHPELPIYVRVKYDSDRQKMFDLGASDVVWEEYEAGEELALRTLAHLRINIPESQN